jgi:hypothetical protein
MNMSYYDLSLQKMIDLLISEKDYDKQIKIYTECLNILSERNSETIKDGFIGFSKNSNKAWEEMTNFKLLKENLMKEDQI